MSAIDRCQFARQVLPGAIGLAAAGALPVFDLLVLPAQAAVRFHRTGGGASTACC